MAKAVNSDPKTPGRKPGSPRVPGSGRKVGTKNKITLPIKEMILKRGRPVELLCDVSRGLKIRVGPQAGPGEPEWCYPDLQTRINAARTLLGKIIPDLRAQELTGKDGADLLPKGYAMPDRELARRCALILTLGDPEKAEAVLTDGRRGELSLPRHGAGGEDTAAGETPAPLTPSASSPDRSNGSARGGGGPLSDPGASEPTQHPVSEFQNKFSKNAKPTVPKLGEEAVVGEHVFDGASRLVHPIKIRNLGPDRAGLPDKFVIIRDGLAVKHVGGDFDAALAWVREKFDLADVPMSIGAVGPEGPEPVRPDQMPFAVGGIEITRGYPERKN